MTTLLALGLFVGDAAPVRADPPSWSHGRNRRDNRRSDSSRRGRQARSRSSDRVSYGPHDRYGDLDRDGVPNYRDRRPNHARRQSRRFNNQVGYGPHARYGDLDRDGVPNYRDRRPNHARRRY